MTRASLRALTKTDPCCRAPEAGHAILVYKARLAAALAKAPPKASLFGERRPSWRYKMKEMSPSAPTPPWTVAMYPVNQDHGKLGNMRRRHPRRYVVSLPAKNEWEGESERLYKGHPRLRRRDGQFFL